MSKNRQDSSEHSTPSTTLSAATPTRYPAPSRLAPDCSPSDKTPTHSRSSSLWTAPSSPRPAVISTPALPRLPRAPARDSTRSFQSPQQSRTDSSAYYTAVWGSPYDLPPLGQPREGLHRHYTSSSGSSSEALGDSPSQLPRLREALQPIQQSPIGSHRQRSSLSGIGSSPRPTLERSLTTGAHRLTEKRSRHGFTQDWLRNNLAGSRNSEKGNWWSDDSGGSDIENLKADASGLRKPSLKPWFGEHVKPASKPMQESSEPLDQPTPRSKPSQQPISPIQKSSAHQASPSEITVKQEDFDTDPGPAQQRVSSVKNTLSSIFSNLNIRDDQTAAPKQPDMDKPLPQPPLNRTASEAPILQHSMSYYSPTREKRPSLSSIVSFQRPKKKVVWRGKACIIAMPLEDEGHPRGLTRVRPLFEDDPDSCAGNGQSRGVYPDPLDGAQELEQRDFRVRIPKKKAWDEYVNQLKEEKLRALGVSFGDEDTPPLPPRGPLPMIRQVMSQIPSAPMPLPRPPSLNPGYRPGHPALSQSPGPEPPPGLSQQPVRQGFQHLPRQSVSFPNDSSLAPFAQPMHHQLPSGPWPQSGYFANPLNSRGVSPLVNGQRPGISSTSSYNSSLHRGSVPDDNRRASELIQPKPNTDDAQFQQQWQQPRNSVGSHRPNINGSYYRPIEDYPVHRFISQPEIASPVPKGHRHNLSQTLQKEIEDAEKELEGSDYHLEESVRREFEDDDDLKSLHDGSVSPSTMNPNMSGDGHQSFGRVTSGSDLDTNPSLQNSPAFSTFPGRPSFSKHGSKTSMSTLNVNAQEFVFEPHKPAQPDMFSFGRPANLATNPSKSWPALPQPPPKDTALPSSLNVTAPAFTPSTAPAFSAPNREFSFSSSGPTFRPDAPAFQPIGLTSSLTSEHSGSDAAAAAPRIFGKMDFSQLAAKSAKTSKAIPIVKPASSRSSPERDDEGQEDETGRITQADGRQKRLRRGGDDGDRVPLFATPVGEAEVEGLRSTTEADARPEAELAAASEKQPARTDDLGPDLAELAAASEKQQVRTEDLETAVAERLEASKDVEQADEKSVADESLGEPSLKLETDAKNTIAHIVDEDDLEGSPIERATGQLQELVDDLLTSETASLEDEFLVGERLEKPWQPIEMQDEQTRNVETVSMNEFAISGRLEKPWEPIEMQDEEILIAERILDSELEDVPLTVEKAKNIDLGETDVSESPAVQELSHQAPKASLSATAVPFEYKPGVNGTVVALDSVVKSLASTIVHTLADSRYAPEPDPLANMVFSPQSSSEEDVTTRAQESLQTDSIPVTLVIEDIARETPFAEELVLKTQDDVEAIHQEIDHAVQELSRHELNFNDLTQELSVLETDLAQSPEHSESSSSSEQSLPRSVAIEVSDSVASPGLEPCHRDSLPSASPNRLQDAFQYLPGPERSYSADSAVVEFVANNPRLSPSYRPGRSSSIPSPVHRLTANDIPISDWDDIVDSEDEVKFLSRTGFFDKKVDGLVGATVKAHLGPLEQSLIAMRESIAQISARSISKRGRQSAEIEESDADDEDDEVSNHRTRSPLKERKLDKIKASISDLVSTQQDFARANDVSQIAQTVAELKGLMQSQLQEPRPKSTEIKNIVEEAVSKQLRGKSGPITSSTQSAGVEKLQLQVAGLESMITHAEARAEVELQCRMLAEKALEDRTRALRVTEDEASAQRESAEEAQRSLHAYHEERKQAQQRDLDSDETIEALRTSILGLNEKNTALEGTLDEYRLSSTQWREEIDEAQIEKANLERAMDVAREDNSNLDRTIHALKSELEDGIRGRQAMNVKFERIQEDIARMTQDVVHDQSEWRHRDEEHKARHDLLSARLEAEARTRERLEVEIERLESQEKEAMRSRFMAERYREEIEQLSTQVQQFTAEKKHDRDAYAELKRDMLTVRETAKLDVEYVRASMDAALGSSNHQAKLVHGDLEATIARLQSQLAAAEADTAALKARHELMLDEASESRNEALREAAEARESALQEHFRFHERTVESATQQLEAKLTRALEEKDVDLERLGKDHVRALEERDLDLDRLRKDSASMEATFAERSALADEKVAHYVDRVAHLEERLAIAKSAAHAAVQAVQSARESTTSSPPAKAAGSPALSATTHDKSLVSPTTLLPSLAPGFPAKTTADTLPPKISPQALRETILVLTEQLHDREARLEALNPDSPQLIKNLELETAWLRELLAVRLDDLKELIASLSQPGGGYDVARVKDAAIRLKAGLEMEVQERERRGPLATAQGGPSQLAQPAAAMQFPSLASITNLATASPRALPLAAAAAWGNWRKTGGGLSESFGASWGGGSAAQTPSKPPTAAAAAGSREARPGSASSRFSGLLTPPGTGAKGATPAAMMEDVRERLHAAGGSGGDGGAASQRRPLGRYAASGSMEDSRPGTGGGSSVMGARKGSGVGRRGSRQGEEGEEKEEDEAPRTPTMNLMRRASYDADARDDGHYSLGRYVRDREREEEESEGIVEGRGAGRGEVFTG